MTDSTLSLEVGDGGRLQNSLCWMGSPAPLFSWTVTPIILSLRTQNSQLSCFTVFSVPNELIVYFSVIPGEQWNQNYGNVRLHN